MWRRTRAVRAFENLKFKVTDGGEKILALKILDKIRKPQERVDTVEKTRRASVKKERAEEEAYLAGGNTLGARGGNERDKEEEEEDEGLWLYIGAGQRTKGARKTRKLLLARPPGRSR